MQGAQPPSMPAGPLVRLRGTVPSAQPPITAHSSRLIPAGGPHRPSAQGCHHQSQARHLRPQRPQPGRHSEADTQTVCRPHIGAGTVAQRPPAGHRHNVVNAAAAAGCRHRRRRRLHLARSSASGRRSRPSSATASPLSRWCGLVPPHCGGRRSAWGATTPKRGDAAAIPNGGAPAHTVV